MGACKLTLSRFQDQQLYWGKQLTVPPEAGGVVGCLLLGQLLSQLRLDALDLCAQRVRTLCLLRLISLPHTQA